MVGDYDMDINSIMQQLESEREEIVKPQRDNLFIGTIMSMNATRSGMSTNFLVLNINNRNVYFHNTKELQRKLSSVNATVGSQIAMLAGDVHNFDLDGETTNEWYVMLL